MLGVYSCMPTYTIPNYNTYLLTIGPTKDIGSPTYGSHRVEFSSFIDFFILKAFIFS